jgi:hypothetical protein
MILSALATPGLASDWEEDEGASKAPARSNPHKVTSPPSLQNRKSVDHESETGKTAKGGGLILRGKVEHAQKLPPLQSGLQAGANFDPSSLGKAKYESKWLKIPNWFAGTFASDRTTITLMQDYATGRKSSPNKTVSSQASEHFGFQRDADGDIWHFYVESGSSKSTQQNHETFNTIDWYGPELIAEDKLVMRILATSLIVDRNTGTIVDSYRREDIKTYQPLELRSLKVTYTSKSFDSRGRPRDLQEGYSIYRQVLPFTRINEAEGNDYKSMFRDYLVSHKLEHLVPR